MAVIDYTADFRKAIAAHGKDQNVLILYRLDEPRQRLDRKTASYELEYRWLSRECMTENDEAYCFVQGSETTLWQRQEFDMTALKAGSKNLFDCFQLF